MTTKTRASMKTAILFPGQGSQTVGMARDHMETDDQMRTLFEQANEIFGFDLTRLMFEGPAETLMQTQYTQPAIYLHSYALYRSLAERGTIRGDVMAGHSLGEITALAAASVLTFEDGLRLVAKRGSLMQKAGEEREGAMAAIIGMKAEAVRQICSEASGQTGLIVVPANDNSEGQMVISGDPAAVEKAAELARAAGCRLATMIPVSGAFHSPLMEPAKDAFREVLQPVTFADAKVPVYSNYSATCTTDGERLKENLLLQLTNPVRWRETLLDMSGQGVSEFIEVGPGSVLKGLVKRTVKSAEISVFN